MQNLNQYKGYLIIAGAFIIAVVFIYISAENELTSRENVIFQIFILTFTMWGSYINGQISKQNQEIEEIKPIAKRAFRRVFSIYQGISRMATIIEEEKYKTNKTKEHVLDMLQEIAIGQIYGANNAMDEWKDIIPDTVEEIMSEYKMKAGDKEKGWYK